MNQIASSSLLPWSQGSDFSKMTDFSELFFLDGSNDR